LWDHELASSFPYLETPDQAAAITAVKKDLESYQPMDRLVVGDVGFGKTEVALRAAFRAVNDGRQVDVLLEGRDVSHEIRTPRVDAVVSRVAASPAVRAGLIDLQRRQIQGKGTIMAGRDIGTVVWPDADVKVFLTASEHERARRRTGDTRGGGETAETLARRDAIDSGRAASPTRAAADALVIDSTTRSVDQVVDQLLRLIEAARATRPR
jgi:cytidylate kinase